MKVKITSVKRETIITPTKSAIMQYGGKLHEKYNKKKINVDRSRDLIDYSDL